MTSAFIKRIKAALTLESLFWIFFFVGSFVYFGVLNFQRANDLNMLAITLIDEYAIFRHIDNMLHPPWQNPFFNFFSTVYYYGYPYFFISAFFALPARWIAPLANDLGVSQLEIWIVRQLDVACILASIFIVISLTKWQGRSIQKWITACLILIVPCVFQKNLIIHPDSILCFFLVLVVYFIRKDQFRLGRYFWVSIVFCGLAISTKKIGIFFFPSYIFYLWYVKDLKKYSWKTTSLKAGMAGFLTIVVYIVSTPYLLSPTLAKESFALTKQQVETHGPNSAEKTLVERLQLWAHPSRLGEFESLATFESYFWQPSAGLGLMRFLGAPLILILLFWGVLKVDKFSFLFLLFYNGYFLLFIKYYWAYWYFVPTAILLYGLGIPGFQQIVSSWINRVGTFVVMTFIYGYSILAFAPTNFLLHKNYASVNDQHPSFVSWRSLSRKLEEHFLHDQKIEIVSEPTIYIPNKAELKTSMKWRLPNSLDIELEETDLVVVEQETILKCDDTFSEECLKISGGPEKINEIVQLYSAIRLRELKGYRVLYEDKFLIALVRNI